jgi:hypothetical protein
MLARDIDRFPNFIARKGMTGTVVQHGGYCVCVRMDLHLAGAEEWDNEIEWACEDDRILDFEDDTQRLIEISATFPIELS